MESGIVARGVIASGMMWSGRELITSAALVALVGLPEGVLASPDAEVTQTQASEPSTTPEQAVAKKAALALAGSLCAVSETHPLYLGHHGDKVIAKLGPELNYTLKVAHNARWLVSLANGKLGFVAKSDLVTKASCTLSQSKATGASDTKSRPVQPELDAGDITEVAEALALTKAVAEGVEIDGEVVAEQLAKVERVAKAREDARGADATVGTDGLIRVAVYDLELVNVAAGLGSATTEALLQEVRKLEGVSAIGMDEIREMLDFEAQRQALGLECEADDACFAEIAGALGVDEIITGKLTEQADGRMMFIKRINQRRAEVVTSHTERLTIGSGEEFLLAIGPTAGKLYPTRAYRPGTKAGVPDQLVLRLNPPPIPRLVTEVAGWGALGALLAGGVSYAGAWLQHDAYRSELIGSRRDPIDGDAAAQGQALGQDFERTSIGFFVSSATLAAIYGALYAITDWEGYGDDSELHTDERGDEGETR